ncbi:MAG TPA: 1-(5-phosphoribosyl)-5-[(5-phosphoribosylamino)methylideneamino]imidazole-4-carboxamide isomerase [Ktedonobacteraceae bacterium]|jgi:phosphoribosylformimino-5-aminoimidazole carboxamide ribotide isomerase|nr:1-(5-phosphoribosyl)-5-[(5-phosphoribosylamino)methylideneamino]imidazole-4-carboxamide isomerase [Ktedonobacteraceae bacterium]
MIILPAIDIKNGRCVRLYQGDYSRVTTYDSDPVQVALRWQEAGASWLHVVDLDGAAQGMPVHVDLLKAMRAATKLCIEVGGGLRSLVHIEQILDLGIERVILGTAALRDRTLLGEALSRWGERIAVGLDARDGLIAVAGWHETSHVMATTLAAELCAFGVPRFIYTDIARDGALSGPNLNALAEVRRATWRPLIASGGVSALADLHALAALNVEGVIIGRAIYTGDVDLAAAIREFERL